MQNRGKVRRGGGDIFAFRVSVVIAAGVLAVAFAAWHSPPESSAAGPVHRVVIPGIAMDAVPVVSSTRDVVVAVELDILEPALVGGGQTLVRIRATAHGPLPGQFDPPVTVSGPVTISTHPADVCGWNVVVDQPVFTMTYSQPQGSDLRLHLNFNGPQWHYEVQCPGGAPVIRFPAGGVNESVAGWLGLIFAGQGGPGGATIDTPVPTGGQSCVKRKGLVSNTNVFGAGAVTVWVTQPPCLIALD